MAGADIADVPVGLPDASDREIMIQLARFAHYHAPPSYVVLLSGDEDMFQILRRLRLLGYTTILITPEGRACSPALLPIVNYYVPSRCLFENQLHTCGPIRLAHLQHNQNLHENSADTIVYWDAISCSIPSDQHYQALEYIRETVLYHLGSGSIEIRVYVQYGEVPESRGEGVTYIQTANNKSEALHNTIFSDMVISEIKPKNVVLISGRWLLCKALQFLKTLRVRVFVVVPEMNNEDDFHHILTNVGSLLFIWPPALGYRNVRSRRDGGYRRYDGRRRYRTNDSTRDRTSNSGGYNYRDATEEYSDRAHHSEGYNYRARKAAAEDRTCFNRNVKKRLYWEE